MAKNKKYEPNIRRVKLKKGKFTLEKKVVQAEILALKIIELERKAPWQHKESIERSSPKKANAYYLGEKGEPKEYRGGWTGSIPTSSHTDDRVPILYLKIKKKTPQN